MIRFVCLRCQYLESFVIPFGILLNPFEEGLWGTELEQKSKTGPLKWLHLHFWMLLVPEYLPIIVNVRKAWEVQPKKEYSGGPMREKKRESDRGKHQDPMIHWPSALWLIPSSGAPPIPVGVRCQLWIKFAVSPFSICSWLSLFSESLDLYS